MKTWPDAGGLGREILICEQEGDRITHDIIHRLNSTSVTPIDREDIYALASALDDVVDYTEEAADFMGLYHIEAPMEQAQQLAGVLEDACRNIAQALSRLRGFQDLNHYFVEVNRLENEGDRITREALASLFSERHRPDGRDPLEGHLRAARAGDRRLRARREHPRGDRRQARLSATGGYRALQNLSRAAGAQHRDHRPGRARGRRCCPAAGTRPTPSSRRSRSPSWPRSPSSATASIGRTSSRSRA